MDTRTSTARPRKGGRKRKGDRHLFQSRVPKELAATVTGDAKRLGLTVSDYIAVVLAEKHEYPLPHYYPTVQTPKSVQEELSMKTAS